MVNLIIKFAAFCRAADLCVSTSEVLDCLRHLALINVADEFEFKAAVRTNFVKTQRDTSHFEHLYALFFHRLAIAAIEETADIRGIELRKDVLNALRDEQHTDPLLDSVLDFLNGEPIAFLETLYRIQTREQASSQVLKSNLGVLSGRLEVMLRLNQTRSRIMQLLNTPTSGRAEETRLQVKSFFQRRLDTAFSMITDEKKPENDGLKHVRAEEAQGTGLREKFFSSLTPSEIEEMRDVIAQLVRKFKDIITLRWSKNKRGILDVKKTLRLAGRYQGVPIEVAYKNRPPRKGKIVTLCDVSGSVWAAARFMLNMLYSLQDCFSQVRSFVFVADIAEITSIFEKEDVNEAVEKVMTEADINYTALTDYGETFLQFKKHHMNALTKKTTLIIVGDGRSNYFSPREHILEEMREKCRRVIWLNPEPERFWGDGDSEMNAYKAYCHEVRPCQNMNQLSAFIEDLVL